MDGTAAKEAAVIVGAAGSTVEVQVAAAMAGSGAESGAHAVAAAADNAARGATAPQTPQRRRQTRGGRGRTPQGTSDIAVGQTPQASKTPPPTAPQDGKKRTPQAARTPQTSHTTTTAPSVGSRSQLADDDSDDDGAGILGDLGIELDDDEDIQEPGHRQHPSWADARGPSKGHGRGKSAGKGGRGGQYGKGAAQQARGSGGQRDCRLPPPPSSGSLKALPQEHVHRFLELVQNQDYAEALKALRKVRRAVKGRGCSKEAFGGMRALLHHLLEGYAASGRLQEAIELLGDMKKGTEARLVSAAAFNAVLRGLLARNALEESRYVVRQEMPRLGASPNEASLNLLMDTAARAGHTDEAWDVLEEMQQRSLRADKYTVSILTKGISERSGDKWRAPRGVALVERFLVAQPEDVDEVLVNSLLDVFCRMGDMPRLESTLQKMHEYGIKGSAVTYGTIVKAYGRAGNIEKVLHAWSEMSRVGLEANAVTYGCMLDACVKCGHLDKALNVFAAMKEHGLHRNTILYATLIKGFAKSKDPLAARNLHREMIAEGVPCNVVVFNSLIDACVRANDLTSAAEVLQEMTVAGVKPDLITFSTLIKGYCSSGELSKAMRLAQELQARNLECDEIVYNSLLEGCVKAGDLQLGMRLFTEMKARGVRPSSVTFSILVKLLSRTGRVDLAFTLVASEMREMHGVVPTRMVWSCLVTCCVKSRDLARAAMVLDHLDKEGGNASCGARGSMYATVIEGCLAQADIRGALQLCERAYRNAAPEEYTRGTLVSTDLLRRVFEAAGCHGPESEARTILSAIGPRVGEQAVSTCEDALARGSRRRKEKPIANGDDSQSFASTDAAWNGSAATAVAQQWAAAQQYAGAGAFHGGETALATGHLSAVGHQHFAPPPFDPAIMAAAAAALAVNPLAFGLEGYPGLPGYGGLGGYPSPDYLAALSGGWPYPPPWDGSTDWAAAAAAAHAAAAVALAGTPGESEDRSLDGLIGAPPDPAIAAVGSAIPGSPGPSTITAATPNPAGAAKSLEQMTPATTAPRSCEQLRSPGADEDGDVNATVRLFAAESPLGASTGKVVEHDQAAVAAAHTLPPGLC